MRHASINVVDLDEKNVDNDTSKKSKPDEGFIVIETKKDRSAKDKDKDKDKYMGMSLLFIICFYLN
jgi:hypothetical protein